MRQTMNNGRVYNNVPAERFSKPRSLKEKLLNYTKRTFNNPHQYLQGTSSTFLHVIKNKLSPHDT